MDEGTLLVADETDSATGTGCSVETKPCVPVRPSPRTAVSRMLGDSVVGGTGGERYELKLVVRRDRLATVRAWLRLHPAAFSKAYPPREVNSIYFDTPELHSANDNLAGVSSRCKLRLRWYGERCPSAPPTMELKLKRGGLGDKRQHVLAAPVQLEHTTWSAVLGQLRRQLPGGWRVRLDERCCPTVLICYRRMYYSSADRTVRVTVDRDLAVFDQFRSTIPNLHRATPVADRIIIEVKAGAAHYGHLAEVASSFPARIERSSKYVSAALAALAG
ncbi:MAG: polyphosphate polymerase domain-containing protein [bacterium]|nr:polyphosphate polymerase domain-containing protein [bacterium]